LGAGTVLKTNAIDREERVMITGHQWKLGLRFRREEQRVEVLRGRVFFNI